MSRLSSLTLPPRRSLPWLRSSLRLSHLLAALCLTLLSCGCCLPSTSAQSYTSYAGFQPISLTFDSAGRLWVLDIASLSLLQLSPTGGAELGRIDVSQLTPSMECPETVRVDAQGRFFVVDACNGIVYVVSPTGQQLQLLTTQDPELSYPSGLALDPSGAVYIADTGNQRVVKLDSAGVEVADLFDTLWSAWDEGQMEPGSVALDGAGCVYVSDWNNYVVIKFDAQGNQLAIFNVSHSLQTGERFYWVPMTVAVDASGNVWVANFVEDYILTPTVLTQFSFSYYITKFAPNGTLLLQFNSSDSTVFQLEPNDLAVDAQGNLWAADTWNGRIVQISPSGVELGAYTNGALPFIEPMGVAVDSSNNMYVADGALQAIVKLSPTGQVLARFAGDNPSRFRPTAVVLDSANNMYVSDEESARVVKLSPQGAVLQVFNTTRPPLSWWLRGVAVDAARNVYLVDADLNRVVKWAPNGTHLYSYTGQLRYPSDVAVDAGGDVWVADYERNRVVRFLNNGSQVATFTTSNPTLSYPEGLVIDPRTGYLYIADTDNSRIAVLSPTTGALLATIASPGGVPMCPFRMAMNGVGDLLVTDVCGDRLLVFQLSTSSLHWIVAPAGPSSSGGVSGGALGGVIVGCVLGGSVLTCLVLALVWCVRRRGDGEGGEKRSATVKEVGGGGKLQFKRQSDDDEVEVSTQAVEMS